MSSFFLMSSDYSTEWTYYNFLIMDISINFNIMLFQSKESYVQSYLRDIFLKIEFLCAFVILAKYCQFSPYGGHTCFPRLWQHMMVIFANLKDEKYHLSVVLICISLIMSEVMNVYIF